MQSGRPLVRVLVITPALIIISITSLMSCKNVISGSFGDLNADDVHSKAQPATPVSSMAPADESDDQLFNLGLDPYEGVDIAESTFKNAAASAHLFIKKQIIPTELLESVVDHESFRVLVESLLISPSFEALMMEYHQSLFSIQGANYQVESDSKNLPTYLASFVVSENRPYTEVLTADYCVTREDGNFVSADGLCPNDSPDLPIKSGVLSDTALLIADAGARNITRLKRAHLRFICLSFDSGPDPTDPGLAVEEVDARYGGAGQGDEPQFVAGSGASCNSCHGAISARYGVYAPFRYSLEGESYLYDPSRGIDDVEPEVLNGYETAHLMNGQYQGRSLTSLNDLAYELAEDPRFSRCATQRFYNFIFGKQALSEIPQANLQYFRELFEASEQSVRELFLSIIDHPVYVQRFEESES